MNIWHDTRVGESHNTRMSFKSTAVLLIGSGKGKVWTDIVQKWAPHSVELIYTVMYDVGKIF